MDEKMARLKSQGKLKEEAALAALHAAQEELAAAQGASRESARKG
jgi:hypothetical protein